VIFPFAPLRSPTAGAAIQYRGMRRTNSLRALCLAVALPFALAACGASQTASPDASGRPSASASTPRPESTSSSAPHPTPLAEDPDAILLQFDATPDSIVDPFGDPNTDGIGTGSHLYLPGPDFTLYADGRVIFRNDEEERRNEPNLDGRSIIGPPLLTVRLSQEQVREVLDFAWEEGGLADALPVYSTGAVDLFVSGSFEMSAGDRHRRVFMHGLFPDPGHPDPETRLRLLGLVEYLRNIDVRLGIEPEPWVPDRFWAGLRVVDTSFVGGPLSEWPWPHIQPEGWVDGRRSLSPSEVAALGLGPLPGGYCCSLVAGPDGNDPPFTGYGISLAPALPRPIATDGVADVVTTDLVVRTAPGTGDDSTILDGRLEAPQLLYVADGPVTADGFDWYLVQPFSYESLASPPVPAGWVAAGSRDGEPWIAPRDIGCPPEDLDAIATLSGLSQLACFGEREIALHGILGECFSNDTGTAEPAWMLRRGCTLLHANYSPRVTGGYGAFVFRTKELAVPAPSLAGTRIHVTGHFDDPGAADCSPEPIQGEEPLPPKLVELYCRTQFVATSISDSPPADD
jgi:hypothetical protein